MAYIDCLVDTNPMATQINTVSSNVNGTTTAVVAMQTAVVLAEEKAANHVCDNINKGFYTMMRSQISQKIGKLQSEVDSHLIKLNQLKKSLLAIQSRMQRDYNMTSSRYLKLFNRLNTNLKQCVFELDKPVIKFAIKDVEQISNRTKYLAATIPVTQLESLSASQKIIASNVKYRGLNVINSMKSFLNEMREQKKLTNRILLENYNVENAEISVPVLVCECNHDKYDNKSFEITVSNVELNSTTKTTIKDTVFNNADQLPWQTTKEIDLELRSEFSNLVSTSSSSQRVKDLANKLFMANNFQIVKNSTHELPTPIS
jgi:CHASE3 domain sensor protein